MRRSTLAWRALRVECLLAACLLAACFGAGCGPDKPPAQAGPQPRWDAPAQRAIHPEGKVFVEFPGFLEPKGATERAWLHLTYKAPDAMFSAVFLRDCGREEGSGRPCEGGAKCVFRPGETSLLPLGRERGRMLQVVRARYDWETQPKVCAIVNLRVASRRPEYGPLSELARELPSRIRVVTGEEGR